MIRVGIAGAHWIADVHAAAVRSYPGVAELVAVAELEPERRCKFAERWGVTAYASVDDLIADTEVDALVLCLPNWLHARAAIAASSAGKHILIEKPMAPTVAECDQIIAAAEQARVKLMVGLTRRYYPAIVAGAEAIAAGAIGTPIAAEARYVENWRNEGRPSWYKSRALGGGMWIGSAVHCVDGLAFLLQSEIAAVRATIGRRVQHMDADDFGFAWFELSNGTSATVLAYGYRMGVYQNSITIYGTDGFLRCERRGAFVGKAEKWQPIDVRGRWPQFENDYTRHVGVTAMDTIAFHLEWGAFLGSIVDDTPSPIPGEYGRHIVAALIAAEQSALTGREVRLDKRKAT